jgi:hypothetical protein
MQRPIATSYEEAGFLWKVKSLEKAHFSDRAMADPGGASSDLQFFV